MKKKKPYKKYSQYRQGIYKPVNSEKYRGKGNPRYLSSWELKFFKWCEQRSYSNFVLFTKKYKNVLLQNYY